MKKLVLSLAIMSALGLSGCDSETIEDVKADTAESGIAIVASARIVFDPGADEPRLSVPNDLLFSDTTDGTLNMPDENIEDQATDYLNPSAAIGALDGWSTTNPFSLEIDFPTDRSLDAASVFSGDSVKVFECNPKSLTESCTVASELIFGVDFIAQASGNDIAIVPLKPLKAKTAYIVALTNNLTDNTGQAISGSSTYESVRQDITVNPLVTDAQLGLQSVINSYESAIVAAGVDPESLIYTMSMTTQSIQDVTQAIKLLMLSGVPGTTPVLSDVTPTGANAAMLLGLDPNDLGAGTQASFASVAKSTLAAPYYLETPYYDGGEGSCNLLAEELSVGCPDLFGRWTAMGDSPVTVLGALQSGVLSQESFVEQAMAQGQDPADLLANTSKLAGLAFTITVPYGDGTIDVNLDQTRHLTQYNPIPQVKSYKSALDGSEIDVFITTPDVDRINAIAALKKGSALTVEETMDKPGAGWPVMIYSHGITSKKETVLAISGALASAGIATISIDHPYHGTRSTDFNNDGVYEITATVPSATDPDAANFANANPLLYMNLSSLLTARDNVRQSEADLLALRLGLNGANFAGELDATKVSFFGISWGAITGTPFLAVANSGVIDPSTGETAAINPYQVNSASLSVPGGGLSGLMLESPTFGPGAKAGLTASDSFIVLATATATSLDITVEQLPTETVDALYNAFKSEFNFAGQTILDSADPINYAATVKMLGTPIHLQEIIGDEAEGGDNKSDQVVVNSVASLPLVGTEPLINTFGLEGIDSTLGDGTSAVSAAVRFLRGHHSSSLNPAAQEGVADDAAATLAVTVEMQTEIVSFAASSGKLIRVADDSNIQAVD